MNETQLQQRLDRLEVIWAMGLAIDRVQARRGSLDELLVTVHEGICKLMDAENFMVALCDEKRENFRFAYYRDTVDPDDPTEAGWIPLAKADEMLTTSVIRNARPLLIDAEGFRQRDNRADSPGYIGVTPNHWMGMPLLLDDGQAVGAMVVQTYQPDRRYSAEDEALFQLLANNVAVSLGRVQKLTWLEQAVKDRTQALEAEIVERRRSEALQRALYEISALFNDEQDQAAHYARLHEIIGRLIPARNFFVAVLEAEIDHFRMVYFVDETEEGSSRAGERYPIGDGLTSLVFRSGQSFLLDQAQITELAAQGRIGRRIGSQTSVQWLGVPLILEGQTIGAIVTQTYDASVTLTSQDMELLNFVARHVAGTLGKVRAQEALRVAQDELVQRNRALTEALETLRSAQDELVRRERLASLGALVAGIAHEINTPLGVCVTATSHLEEELNLIIGEREKGRLSDEEIGLFLDGASDAVRILKTNTRRAARLIRSFKQISVDQSSGEMRTIDLASYLGEVHAALAPSLKGRDLSVEIHCPEGLRVHTNPGALAQVLTNLIMNSAIHAFDEGAAGRATISASVENDLLRLQYGDNGHGMDAAGLKKLFDPFYTTKRGVGGSGLGAHVVYNLIVGPLGGRVQASSEPGLGLHYDIQIPIEPPPGPFGRGNASQS